MSEYEILNAEGFDAWATESDETVRACDAAGEYPFAGYADLMDQLTDIVHAREGVSVLDLGCGTGALDARLSALGHPVTGLDFSEKMLEQAQQLQKMSQATNTQLIWIASISLLVGGIGVMNIMLVSVTERTSEIGLKKAIGAKKKRILLQFLTESAVLTSLGGIIGVVSGVILAQAISKIMQIPVSISVPAIGVAVVFSTLIGVIFGMLPAIQAANLNPIEALRRE